MNPHTIHGADTTHGAEQMCKIRSATERRSETGTECTTVLVQTLEGLGNITNTARSPALQLASTMCIHMATDLT